MYIWVCVCGQWQLISHTMTFLFLFKHIWAKGIHNQLFKVFIQSWYKHILLSLYNFHWYSCYCRTKILVLWNQNNIEMQLFIKSLRIYQIRSLVTYLNCMRLDLLYYKMQAWAIYSKFVITLKLMDTFVDNLHSIKIKHL